MPFSSTHTLPYCCFPAQSECLCACRYLRVGDTVSNDLERLPLGRMYDPRPFANVSLNTFTPADMYRRPECHVKSRNLFGQTTAYTYHSVDNESLAQTITYDQLDPDAYGFVDASARRAVAVAVAANGTSEEEEAAGGAPAAGVEDELVASTNHHAAALDALYDYQRTVVNFLKRHASDVDEVALPRRYPYPGLVYDIHDHVLCPEVFVLIQFPVSIAARVTPYILHHGHAPDYMQHVRVQLAAIDKLARCEADPHSRGPLNYDQEDLLHDAEEMGEGRDSDVLTEYASNLKQQQHDVVLAAIGKLNSWACGSDHPLLFNPVHGRWQASSHTEMNMDEFLWIPTHQRTSDEDENVLYVYERLRHVIRKDVRQAANLDTGMLEEFGRVRALSGDTLETIRNDQRMRADENALSRLGDDYAKSRVDPVDHDFRALDDFLDQRVDNQCALVLRDIRAHTKHAQLTTEEQRRQFLVVFREQTYAYYRLCVSTVISTLQTSVNIPASLSSADFQSYYIRVCNHEGFKAVLGNDIPQYDYAATPFTVCMQQLVDLVTDVHKTSPVTLNPAQLVFFCAMDGLTYEFDRRDPALSVLVAAATGIGKSFMGQLMAMLFPPGIVMPLTNVTKNTFNAGKSYDAVVIVFNEMKQAWIGSASKEMQAAASEEVAFFKDRATRFMSEVHRPVKDSKTGKIHIEISKASHHNVTIGFTNSNMVYLEAAVRRRFLVLHIPRNLSIPSPDPDIMSNPYGKSGANKMLYERVRMVMALFVTVRCAHKAAALPRPNVSALTQWLQRINEEAHKRGMHKMFELANMHWVMQLSIIIQLYYACWYALLSPDAHAFHAMPNAPERWSADAILQLVGPNMAVTKPALIYSLGLLENVIMPVYIQRLLKDILLEGIQLGSGSLHVRRTDVADRGNVNPRHEFEYITFTDRNRWSLLTTIQRCSKDYEHRIEEIELFFKELSEQRVAAKVNIDGTIVDEDNTVRSLLATPVSVGAAQRSVAPVIMEKVEVPGRKTAYHVCFYVPYLEQVLKIRLCDNAREGPADWPAEATKLASTTVQRKLYSECTDSFLAEHMTLKPENSVLMDIVRVAMESNVLEKSPLERPGWAVDPCITRYITPLHPEPIIMQSTTNPDKGIMVMLHATGRQLQLRRTNKPMSKLMVTDYSQPTSERTLKRARESERARDMRGELLRGASTMTSTLCDPDYTAAREMVEALCLPVSPLVRRAYGDKVALRPGLVIPLGFMPVAYFVARELSHRTGADQDFLDYPMVNVRYKVDNADKRLRGIESNEISNDHVDLELMSGTATIGGMTFSTPAISTDAWNAYKAEMDAVAMDLDTTFMDLYFDTPAAGGAVPVAGAAATMTDVLDAMDIDVVV